MRATRSRLISMRCETRLAATFEPTSSSRGKYVFLMRLALPTSDPIEPLTPVCRKLNGSRPHKRYNAKICMPLGLPVGACTFRKNRKTTVKISMVDSGFSSDQAQPSTERLYLVRSSRSVRLLKSSREDAYSAMLVIEVLPARHQP